MSKQDSDWKDSSIAPTSDQIKYVENLVIGEFNEEKLKELFHSEEYRPYADIVFERAVTEGNREIAAESILWWQDAVAREQQEEHEEITPEREEKAGGEIYLIIMTLFIIAYAIKYFMD